MDTKVTIRPTGPILIEGNFVIKDVGGRELKITDKVYLCGCGKTKKRPFCDGEHKR